ncbi:MAG: cytidylate kinase-like family protein [Anaerolineaceae bacterium]
MNFAIQYISRNRIRSVAVTTELNLRDVGVSAERLRSWAKIREVPVQGPPVLILTGDVAARVHLPIGAELMPHPETGIELEAIPSGVVAKVADVRFGELRAVGRELQSILASSGRSGPLEFHSTDGDFFSGDLVLPLQTMPTDGPTILSLTETQDSSKTQQPIGLPIRVLTIARQHGAGGEAIALAVARQLGLRHVDYEVFRSAAEQAGTSPETLESAAQHRGLLARLLDSFARTAPASVEMWTTPVSLYSSQLYTSAEYRIFIEDAIRDLAEQGDVVIVGHGAQLVLANRPDTYRVLITGSVDKRVARAVAQGLPMDDARRSIRDADEERVAYFREFYGAGWLDPASYDLVINTDLTNIEQAVAIVVNAVKLRSRGAATEIPASTHGELVDARG